MFAPIIADFLHMTLVIEELNEQRTRLKSTRAELAQLQFDFAEARSNDTSSAVNQLIFLIIAVQD